MQEVFERRPETELPPPGYRSVRRRQSNDAATRRLVIIAGTLGVGLVAVGGIWKYADRRSHEVPVIEADSRPLRIKPDNPGGMQIAGANETILSGSDATPDALAPPPEAPDPGGLQLQEKSAHGRDSANAAASIPGLNRPGSAAPDVPPPPQTDGPPQLAAASVMPLLPAPGPVMALPAPHAEPAHPAPVQPAAQKPAAAPRAEPHSGGGRQAQLGALSSEAAAQAEWQRLARRLPDLLGNRHPEVTQFAHEGHVFWRLRTGGFADASAVSAFCGELHAKGVNCAPAGL